MLDDKRLKTLPVFIAIASSIIAYFFSPRVAASIIVGQLSFQIYYQLLSIYFHIAMNTADAKRAFKAFVAFICKLLRMLVLAAPYLLAGFYPESFSFLAIFFGQWIFKALMMINAVLQVVNNKTRKEKE